MYFSAFVLATYGSGPSNKGRLAFALGLYEVSRRRMRRRRISGFPLGNDTVFRPTRCFSIYEKFQAHPVPLLRFVTTIPPLSRFCRIHKKLGKNYAPLEEIAILRENIAVLLVLLCRKLR